jgi:predicted Rossmann fold flavoprotein
MDANREWDVVVVGGGPSGMMAAGTAAEMGATVILLEKNGSLGRKLLISGGGRCNLTNAEFDTRKLLEHFKGDRKFLYSAFSQWSAPETLDFFHGRGMETKVEKEQRVFPVSNSSESVLRVLLDYMREHGVTVRSNAEVTGFARGGQALVGVTLKDGSVIRGRALVIATGGISRPETGSTGDGYRWLRAIGHRVVDPTPSLVPIALKDAWVPKLAGISLTDIRITMVQAGKKQGSVIGKLLFTHVGVSGPTILNMSKDIGESLRYGPVSLLLDLLPGQDDGLVNAGLLELFRVNDKKKLNNALGLMVPPAMAPVVLDQAGVDGETPCSRVTREQRLKVAGVLKGIRLQVDRLLGVEKAVISNGGVVPEEVDFRTMRSRLFPNLYLVGDTLHIDRPSGGYSLQLCWTTGAVAGVAAASGRSGG